MFKHTDAYIAIPNNRALQLLVFKQQRRCAGLKFNEHMSCINRYLHFVVLQTMKTVAVSILIISALCFRESLEGNNQHNLTLPQ